MKLGITAIALAALLNLSPILRPAALAQQQQTQVPDAPTPQAPPPLTGVQGTITPGKGAGEEQPGSGASSTSNPPAPQQPEPSSQPPSVQGKDTIQATPPEMPAAGEGVDKLTTLIHLNVNFVEVPVTVKDSKGKLVAGLTFRDFKVYENDTRVPLALFTVDPFPLSIAFVIDQSLTSDVMAKVNDSLGAIQGALTPYDEVAVFSYTNGAQERTGFTGAQSNRLPAVLALTKETGSEELVPVNSGPLAGCNIRENGGCVDPNLQPGRSAGSTMGVMTIPKEVHTLNDAILAAAKELSSRPRGRRRIIYVVSDGKEYGSKATYKEVLRYLQTNNIAVYGTLVGDSARWGEGYVSRVHLPFTMYDNILYKYIAATGGAPDSERGTNGIEKSYAKIAEEARTQYTLGYYTHQPFIDGKFRKIDVRVDRPGLDVIAKNGYYPNARDSR
ncbi:MAG: VWA domain-containing protein [Terracidiphilus sp.]